MIESRLRELSESLADLSSLRKQITKDGGQPSPGLLDNIRRLEDTIQSFTEARDLWRVVMKVHPNYKPLKLT